MLVYSQRFCILTSLEGKVRQMNTFFKLLLLLLLLLLFYILFYFIFLCRFNICLHLEVFSSPSPRALENYFPLAGVEVIDEHQALLRVAVDAALGVTDLHGETGRRFRQKPLHLCHFYPLLLVLLLLLTTRDSSLQLYKRQDPVKLETLTQWDFRSPLDKIKSLPRKWFMWLCLSQLSSKKHPLILSVILSPWM